jgi:DNA-binding transcriptional LysR family regulator
MDFDSRLLRSFAVIVQEGTLTRAAQRERRSDPGIARASVSAATR